MFIDMLFGEDIRVVKEASEPELQAITDTGKKKI
jgi:hypothetical protein